MAFLPFSTFSSVCVRFHRCSVPFIPLVRLLKANNCLSMPIGPLRRHDLRPADNELKA